MGAVIAATLVAFSLGSTLSFARVYLSSTVTWTDAQGHAGNALFQGVVDGDAVQGSLEAGGQRVAATGTVDATGSVTGTLKAAGGEVGTFTGTLRDGAFEGQFTVTGASGGAWVAPSTSEVTAEAPAP